MRSAKGQKRQEASVEGAAVSRASIIRMARPLKAIRCLVVEDDDCLGAVEERVLTAAGAIVTRVRSLAEGRQALRAKRWELVILDLGLPDGNGLELAHEAVALIPRPGVAIASGRLDLLTDANLGKLDAIIVTKAELSAFLVDAATAALKQIGLLRAAQPLPHPAGSQDRRLTELAARFLLSVRQREYLRLLLRGSHQKEMSQIMGISESTVRFHAAELYKRCGVQNQRELLLLVGRDHASD